MPVNHGLERSSLSLPDSSEKSDALASKGSTEYEESNGTISKSGRLNQRRASDSPRKLNVTTKYRLSTATSSVSQTSTPRRSSTNDGVKQSSSSSVNGSGNEKSIGHYNQQQQRQSPPPSKPKCALPTTVSQSGYVTPSKLFNIMGYGLQNQYLFMHAHYLYIIDCRSREKFNECHIITAIHWEDALNGTVYISIVERFSEIVLYDEKGIFFNTTAEMRRVSSRFSPSSGSRSCVALAGGFDAFRALFPFICTQSDIRSTVDREKFLTIYPSVVLDNQLYLGTGHQATNWKVVRDLKLTHIINISIEHQCVFAEKIKYLHLEIEDKEDVLLKDRFDETIRFMNLAFENPSNRILVHCNLGISRSTTLILAYLMKTYTATVYEAFKFLRHRRPIVCPNLGFLRQLIDYEYDLFSYTYTDPNDPIFH